jgi:hypothetical protein
VAIRITDFKTGDMAGIRMIDLRPEAEKEVNGLLPNSSI